MMSQTYSNSALFFRYHSTSGNSTGDHKHRSLASDRKSRRNLYRSLKQILRRNWTTGKEVWQEKSHKKKISVGKLRREREREAKKNIIKKRKRMMSFLLISSSSKCKWTAFSKASFRIPNLMRLWWILLLWKDAKKKWAWKVHNETFLIRRANK